MKLKLALSNRQLIFAGLLYILAFGVALVWFFGPSLLALESKPIAVIPLLITAGVLVLFGAVIVTAFINKQIGTIALETSLIHLENELSIKVNEMDRKANALDAHIKVMQSATNGFVALDISESDKPMFIDLLRGFEEFSALKGFPIAFSINNTEENKISFKMTVRGPSQRSDAQVQIDWKEYIDRVGRGDELNDLPMVLPFAEHNALLLAMRNRISFLTHTYTAQKNVIEFYKQAMANVAQLGFQPSQNFYLSDSANVDLAHYSATGSTQVAQGRSNKLQENTATVKIGINYKERFEQSKQLETLIDLLEKQVTASKERDDAIRMLKNVGDELTKETPEPTRVKEWLETAKNSLQTISLGSDVVDAVRAAVACFGIR